MHLDSISALVTGGSSGLGLATVRRLLAAGARVGIADLNPPSDEDLAGLGANVVYAKTDVTDEAVGDGGARHHRGRPRRLAGRGALRGPGR